jgi:hypothetical protein
MLEDNLEGREKTFADITDEQTFHENSQFLVAGLPSPPLRTEPG